MYKIDTSPDPKVEVSQMIGLGLSLSLGGSTLQRFSTGSLFAYGEPGVWLDPSDPATLFSDPAGTTQAEIGDPVALVLDKSKGLELGPAVAATEWTNSNYPVFSENDGAVSFQKTEHGGTDQCYSNASFDVDAGRYYQVELEVTDYLGPFSVLFSSTTNGRSNILVIPGAGTFTAYLISEFTGTFSLALRTVETNAGGTVSISRVRELPGYHATQPVVSSRPILGRVPATGRRNLLTRTEEFDNAVWAGAATTNVQIVQNSALAPDGSMTAARYIAGLNAGISSGVSLGQQRDATVTGPHRGTVWVRGVGTTIGKAIRFWWWYSGGSAATGDNVAVTPVLTGDWQQITITPSVTTIGQAFFRLDTGSGFGSFLSGEEMEIWHPQLEPGSEATPYQRVGSDYDVTEAGVPTNHYLSFDGVDDFMETEVISDQFGKPFFACAGFQALGLNGVTSYLNFFGSGGGSARADLAARLSGGSVGQPSVFVRQGGGTQTGVNGAQGALVDLAPHVITGAFQSGDVFLRTDGEEINRVARTIEDTFNNTLRIGHPGQPNNFYGGVYVISNTITQKQIEGVERHVAKHTGVSL